MTDKSPIDILNDIHQMMSTLSTRMTLVEKNIALLHEKINLDLSKMPIVIPVSEGRSHMESLDSATKLGVPKVVPGQNTISMPTPNSGLAKVHGKVHGPDHKPLSNVTVLIKNQKGDTTKQIKTSRVGEWMANLPPGKYALTYTKERMTPIYRFVEVKAGQQDVEVV